MNLFNSIAKLWKKNKYKKASILLLSIIILAVLLYNTIFPFLTQWTYAKYIPQLPDLQNQPQVLVAYIQRMHDAAVKNPTSDETVGKLAMAYHANFFYERAEVCYKLAAELKTHEWRWSYYSALLKEELGDSKGTIEKLKYVININPKASQAWYRLGNAYMKINSFGDAEHAFNQVLKLPEFYPEKISKVDFFNNGAFPLKAYASLFLSRAAFQQKRFDVAETRVKGLIQRYPVFGSAYRLMGQIYHEVGEEEKSSDFTLRAGDFGPFMPPPDPMFDELILSSRNTDFIMKYVDVANKSQNLKWALYLISHILEYNPNDGDALTILLKLSLDSASMDMMGNQVEKYYALYNTDENKLIYMANYMIYRGEYGPALKYLRRAITLNPKAAGAHVGVIQILNQSKQYEQAMQYCQKIIPIEPDNINVRHEYAKILTLQGKFEEAREQLEFVRKNDPNNVTTWFLLGRVSKSQGNSNNAIYYYRKCIGADPTNVNNVLELGNYYIELRRWKDAITHFQNSLQASPNDIDLIERCAWLLAVCPDPNIRNGQKALELAMRLSVRRTFTQHQGMRCGIALAVAYAEMKQFDRAIQVTNRYIERAQKTRMDYYIPRLKSLLTLFLSNKPYRL